MKKSNTLLKTLMRVGFYCYMILLFYFLFFGDRSSGALPETSYRYNLTLFQEIGRFWKYRQVVGFHVAFLNLAGNVIGFMPFGFMMPCLDQDNQNGYKMVVLSFLLSLAVECIQLIFKLGCFDVDDIFLNTIGGALGYLIFAIGAGIRRKRR